MSSIWPPANFTEWPSTRIGALIINGVMLLLMILPPTRRLILLDPWSKCCCCCHELIKAVVLGIFLGMFLHFIPCLWWTCDWGEYDGEAIRGAIWFISGPIISLAILYLECKRSKQESPEEGGQGEKKESTDTDPPV